MHRPHLPRRTGLFLLAGLWVFVVLSLASFRATDWPSPAVYPYGAVKNLCGAVGSTAAYGIQFVFGVGAWPAVVLLGVGIAMAFAKRPITDPFIRGVGLLLLAATAGAVVHHVWPGSAGGLPEGNGGVLGIAADILLKHHFGLAGTRLVLAVSAAVALVLAADDLLMLLSRGVTKVAVKLTGGAVGRARQVRLPRLQIRELAMPGLFAPAAASPAESPAAKPVKAIKVKPEKKAKPAKAEAEAAHLDGAALVVNDPSALDSDEPEEVDEAEEPEEEEDEPDAPAILAAEPPPPPVRPEIVVKLPSTPRKMATAPPPQELGEYQFPHWDDLADAEHGFAEQQEAHVREKAAVLEQALQEYGVDAKVVEIDTGPVITLYAISLSTGTKVSAVTGLSNDISRSLAAESVRIVAPIPGTNYVGIEVPNDEKEKVRLKELMATQPEKVKKMAIPLYLGKDASGDPLIADLASMPHCLIAGTTGSGKSVCINTIIMSIMYTQRPDVVKLILVDPKVVEMAPFKDIPHLMAPVITDSGKATSVLEWACEKMDERYELLAEAGVRNLAGYNKLTQEELVEKFQPSTPEEEAKIPKKMPYMVIIIDELADLMMTSGKEVESYIVRLSQKARAVGIHLILATQRPQATVVTGLIKSNMPSKIAFRVASKMDSRIVLDQNGAELLLGQGDMLYLPPGASRPIRSQGTYIDDKEIHASVKTVKGLAEAQYEPELVQIKSVGGADGEAERDELFDDAVRVVLETRRGSVSLLQRRLTIGYARASRLIEQMAEAGLVGAYKGSQAREATITLAEWDAMKAGAEADAEAGMTV